MMSDSGRGLVATDSEQTTSPYRASHPTKKSGFKRHCSRLWWLYVILLIVIALSVLLPLIYVVFPRIAQEGVDSSVIEITSLSVTDPEAESVLLSQEFVTLSQSNHHPYLDAFEAEIGLENDEPYGKIMLPTTRSGQRVPGSFQQRLNITNLEAFKRYNRALLGSEQLTQFVRGQTELHEGGLPALQVDYNHTATIKGFNSLDGLDIVAFGILSDGQTDGANGNGTVFIPNPSAITVEMGNVTFNNYVDDIYIGNTTIYDLVLRPGDNFYPIRNHIETLAILGFIGPGGTYENGSLPLTIAGNSSVYNGVHLTYYEYALKAANQSVTLDIKSLFE